jgi:hypothetical protein
MKLIPRAVSLVAAGAAALTTLVVASPAVAAVPSPSGPGGCAEPASNYPPAPPNCPPVPELFVDHFTSTCESKVPYLTYATSVTPAVAPTTLTLTFVNPSGADHIVDGLPLQGRLLWPGSELDGAGNVVDWPGWTTQPDGTLVEGDEWSWTLGQVTLLVEVNPSATTTVRYLLDSPVACVEHEPDIGVLPHPPDPGLATNGQPMILPATR